MAINESLARSNPPDGAAPRGPAVPLPIADRPRVPAGTNAVTRKMCAAAYLRGGFADHAAGSLLDPGFTARAPCWGVDVIAVARHAAASRTMRLGRDRQLRWCMTIMIISLVLTVVLGDVFDISPFAVLVLAPLVLLLGWVAAWILIARHYWAVRLNALRAFTAQPAPRDFAPPVDVRLEDRLDELMAANTIIFSGPLPFVGNGLPLDSWTMTLDLAAKSPGTGNNAQPVKPFGALDVYRYLLEKVPDPEGPPVRASTRLYVNGGAAAAEIGGTLITRPPDRDSRPRSRVPESVIEALTRKPTEHSRTYMCFERSGWGGQLLVSLMMRVERTADTLFIEGRSHVLLPLHGLFGDIDKIAPNPDHSLIPLARATTSVTSSLFFGAYSRHLKNRKAGRTWKRDMQKLQEHIEQGYPMDYGAKTSLREEAADVAALGPYAGVDEVMYFQVLKRRALTCLQDFLTQKNVDLREFRYQKHIAMNQTTVFLNDVPGSAGNFGKNTAMVTPNPTVDSGGR